MPLGFYEPRSEIIKVYRPSASSRFGKAEPGWGGRPRRSLSAAGASASAVARFRGYVFFAMGCHVENTGATPLRFLEMFRGPRCTDVFLAQWMAVTPHALAQSQLKIRRSAIDGSPGWKRPVAPG